MDEKKLSDRQRKWLEASRRIGPGPMTRTERETLERLYADMLPKEQQELAEYIQAKFGKNEPEPLEEEGPIEKMQRKVWAAPSRGLRSLLSKAQTPKQKPSKH